MLYMLEIFETGNKGPHCHLIYYSTDSTVHPPVSETHPYEGLDPTNMPPDMGYSCKMINGVVHVFTHKSNMEK